MLEQQLCQQLKTNQNKKNTEQAASIICITKKKFNNETPGSVKSRQCRNDRTHIRRQRSSPKRTPGSYTKNVNTCAEWIADENDFPATFVANDLQTSQYLKNSSVALAKHIGDTVKGNQQDNAKHVLKCQKVRNDLINSCNANVHINFKSQLNSNSGRNEHAHSHEHEMVKGKGKRCYVKRLTMPCKNVSSQMYELYDERKNNNNKGDVAQLNVPLKRNQEPILSQVQIYKIINFNSRRRRGRLRHNECTPSLNPHKKLTITTILKEAAHPILVFNSDTKSKLSSTAFSPTLNGKLHEILANAVAILLQQNANTNFINPNAIRNVADCLYIKILLLLYSIKNILFISCLLFICKVNLWIISKLWNKTFVYKCFQNCKFTLIATLKYIETKATTSANKTVVIATLLLNHITRPHRQSNMKQITKFRLKDDQNSYILSAMMALKTLISFVTNTIKYPSARHQTLSTTLCSADTSVATTTVTRTKLNVERCSFWLSVSKSSLFTFTCILLTTSQLCSYVDAFKPKSTAQQKQQHEQKSPMYNDKHVVTAPPYQLVPPAPSWYEESGEVLFHRSSDDLNEPLFKDEKLQHYNELDNDDITLDDNTFEHNVPLGKHTNATHFDNATKTPLFPKDLFTKEQLENGAVVCHIIGVIYMFVALAIVCDEFFVPSLDVIIEKLGITDDVAGATFMAAGGSAPELFTSVIGVFVSFDDVGIGTIVGSAVFNILFVIGMCALFSRTVLSLTWWPLFRDCSFYSISLIVLIYFFRDNRIYWWEALILFLIYCGYVTFMKWNKQVEGCVKKMISKNKVTRVRSTDQLMPASNAANSSETSMATQPGGSVTSRAASESRSGVQGSSSGVATGNNGTTGHQHTGAKFRHGLLQLMIHTIDPLHDGKVDEKATQLHAIASLKVLLDATKPQRGGATTSAANHVKINLKETTLADRPNGNIDTIIDSQTNDIEDEPEPLSMAWPDTARKRLTYLLVAPLLVPMWLTLPDTRTPRGKRFFPVTFIGSILWIAAFSYLMVWWANIAGDTARIPPEVMGLTFLAAGTSIPDLITSVIVARKGFGDMAVSSSVGSNIFDVTVGLPIPWLLYGIIYDAPVEVNSVGMVCSITILFMMLLFVVMSIACFRWRMNKGLGFTMFLLYFVFVAVSLMFEYDVITCPV